MVDFWWQNDGPEKVHETLFPFVRSIEERQYAIHRSHLFNAKLYTNRELASIDWGSYQAREVSYAPASLTMENLTTSVVDTVTSMIGKNKPKATPVLKDADFSKERLAEQADRYLYGEFMAKDVWRKARKMFNDACWATIGAIKIGIDDDDIFVERVMPDEIIVDQRECIGDDKPIQLFQRKLVSRHQLLSIYPEFAEQITNVQKNNFTWTTYRSPTSDMVVVIEAWMRPMGNMPGKHAICIDNATFVYEDYDRDCFPFVFFRWSELPTGFYGKPLVEEIAPFQLRMNELNRVIKLAQDLMAVPRIFVDGTSKIVKTQLDNEIARILHYRGKPPEVMTWPAVSPEIYNERERTRSSAFQYAGVSELSAQAKLPNNARLDSSKALREYNAIEDGRFAIKAQEYEQVFLQIAEHILELSAELYKNRVNKKVKFHNRTLVDEISWEEVKDVFEAGKYAFQIEASSVLNMTPAARQDTLDGMAVRGLIDPEKYKSLLGHPDLEEELSVLAAGMNDIKYTIELLDKGEYPTPEPLQNLTLGIPYIHMTYLRRKMQNAPEEILQAYRDWIGQAVYLMEDPSQMNFMNPNMGPEGNVTSSVATTAQGTPTQGLI